jgi:hypothetical protein
MVDSMQLSRLQNIHIRLQLLDKLSPHLTHLVLLISLRRRGRIWLVKLCYFMAVVHLSLVKLQQFLSIGNVLSTLLLYLFFDPLCELALHISMLDRLNARQECILPLVSLFFPSPSHFSLNTGLMLPNFFKANRLLVFPDLLKLLLDQSFFLLPLPIELLIELHIERWLFLSVLLRHH